MDSREPSRRGSDESPDFSLVLGGPLFQFLIRSHLAGDALDLVRRRLVVIALFAWLPLFLLSAAQGTLLGGDIAVPFLKDLELHARFLLALPLLIVAELVVHQRMRSILQVFRERGIVPEAARPRFEAAIASAYRLRNSIGAELALVAIVYGFGIQVFWRNFIALDTVTWYSSPSGLTIAGIWYGYVSLPIFQFLLCRWYFRIFIWARFLFHVSRIELSLIPTHPDKLGGFGFLANTVHAFTPLATAHGVMLAGPLASRIFFAGAKLSDFRMEAILLVVLVLIIVFGPLLAFAPQLAAARRTGMREYGTFAERYVRAFDEKWLRGGAPPDESPLGSGDIQSLADLGNSLEVVRTMRTFPITREAVVRLAAATFVPILPLALTMMPLEELLKKLFGMIF
ncbi:MAG TPA: hypothetical protein VFZ53_08110 [Polyangiaceae bacterium]